MAENCISCVYSYLITDTPSDVYECRQTTQPATAFDRFPDMGDGTKFCWEFKQKVDGRLVGLEVRKRSFSD